MTCHRWGEEKVFGDIDGYIARDEMIMMSEHVLESKDDLEHLKHDAAVFVAFVQDIWRIRNSEIFLRKPRLQYNNESTVDK